MVSGIHAVFRSRARLATALALSVSALAVGLGVATMRNAPLPVDPTAALVAVAGASGMPQVQEAAPRTVRAPSPVHVTTPGLPSLAALTVGSLPARDRRDADRTRVVVASGAPAIVPPRRPDAARRPLRPVARPEIKAPATVETVFVSESGTGGLRPRSRPASLRKTGTMALGSAVTRAASSTTQLAPGAQACPASLTRHIPRRPSGAPAGGALVARMNGLHGETRDALIVGELLSGNLPDFLRRLTPVTVTGALPGGRRGQVTICVTPDYLALGSDDDFTRVPMGLPAAAHIADSFGFLLPTTRMVDAIHAQARLQLAPRPMTPGAQMTSTRYFWQHNQTVEGQTRGRAGVLTAGQKKDLVLTNRLRRAPGRVAIYGWHRPNGKPIQPLSTVHGALYSDYSHGVRLVSQTAYVDGRPVALSALLSDPAYARILTGEGPIPAPERLMASLYR